MSKGEETRQAILDRALSLASTEGLNGLSIGGLAEAVGMSKSGLFAHFRSKEQLQLATLRHAADRFISQVVAPALKQPRGEPRIRTLFEAWLQWESNGLPGGCPFEGAAPEFDDREGKVREYLVETQRDWFDSLAQIARTAVDSGAFRKDLDPRTFAFELINIFLGYRRQARLLRDPGAEALARASFEALIARARA